ncbi:MAG: hypothetical protein IKB16_03830 [Lentisphaeria bacterium]|nr:hypothetical protein [Lentisphaeria bacterium]
MKRNLRIVLMILATGLLLCPAGMFSADRAPEQNVEKKGKDLRHHPKKRYGMSRRGGYQPWEEMLSNLPKAEEERLKKLAGENPAQFRKEIFKLIEQRRKKQLEELLVLRKAYLAAPEGAEKEKAKAALRKRIEDNMKQHSDRAERRIRMMEKQLEQFRNRVNNVRDQHEKMKKRQGEFVEKMLRDFTNPEKEPSFRRPVRKEKK